MEENNLFNLLINREVQKDAIPLNTLYNFFKNFKDMENANVANSDKYFHAKANCQSGQYGDLGTATILNHTKELADLFRKNIYPKNNLTPIENAIDSKMDLDADGYGLMQGFTHPFADCNKLLDKYRPSKLNSQY